MEPVPSLREVFAELAGGSTDPAAALTIAGHGDLSDDLVAEAIVNYADAAPVEVAEHLSPFVVAHSPVPRSDDADPDAADTGSGLDLLAGAPSGPGTELDQEHNGLADLDGGYAREREAHQEPSSEPAAGDHSAPPESRQPDAGEDLQFGVGGGTPAVAPADSSLSMIDGSGPIDSEAETAGYDPAALDAASAAGDGWLDVTGSEPDHAADSEWVDSDSTATGPVPVQPPDEPGRPDFEGAGA